ncbi:MAG: adenosine deaminase [Burkholderiaceae bacterium]|nr:adenosine deaminase [Burkholderiaceae bacterium]
MHRTLHHFGLASALVLAAMGNLVSAQAATDEEITRRYFADLVAGPQPKAAELTQFFSMMPKGGDLHHHYAGAIYAEQFLEWVGRQQYCVDRTTYGIETDLARVAAEQVKAPDQRRCLSAADVLADNSFYRELLQRWSDKDFSNHGALQPPPDRQFFDTFGYFWPVADSYGREGMQTLKKRAIEENLLYIETIYEMPSLVSDAGFDAQALQPDADSKALTAIMAALAASLDGNADFNRKIDEYLAAIDAVHAGIDDAGFTMRYQAYVLRLLPPSQVFSSLLAAFKAADRSKLVVGVNIVGAENQYVSMRDYTLHMQMFRFLKAKYPKVKLSLHAGELALGMVPPEGLTFHIKEALDIGGADRIGHGVDLAHETDSAGILREMRERHIPVEVNLTSNEFILGVRDQDHPLSLYRKFGVPFVLATDDAGVSRSNLTGEYVLFASRYRTDYAEIKKLSYDSLRYSFLADQDKQRLLKSLDVRFAKFEAVIARMQKDAVPEKRAARP